MKSEAQLELAANQLGYDEKQTLRAILACIDSTSDINSDIATTTLFRRTNFNAMQQLHDVLENLEENGFITISTKSKTSGDYVTMSRSKMPPPSFSTGDYVTLNADQEQYDTLTSWCNTPTVDSLLTSKRDAEYLVESAQKHLDARVLPLLDHVGLNTHVISIHPSERNGWSVVHLTDYYDETVEFPTAVLDSLSPVEALQLYDRCTNCGSLYICLFLRTLS
jgi:hypothetical protein